MKQMKQSSRRFKRRSGLNPPEINSALNHLKFMIKIHQSMTMFHPRLSCGAWGDKFQMKSVSDKITTARCAKAVSVMIAKPKTIERLKSNDLPKKDVLAVARVAGVQAAKKTFDLIPYCHPIPIDWVEISFDVQPDRVLVSAEVEAIWKTGVEMEALCAASVAALTIYDMLKPVDKDMEIVSTKLVEKKGGKSDYQEVLPSGFKAAVLVTSDGTAQGTRDRKST